MATQSPSPSTPPVGHSPSLAAGSETEKLASVDGDNVKTNAATEFSGKPLLREDQVQNAVNFLSHPRVRSSPIVHRRSFLEKKGLTKEEIDEAFHRVPDPPLNATNEAYATGPALQQKSATTFQRQDPIQTPQPAAAPVNIVSMVPTQQIPRFHWPHALLAVGVCAASGAGTALLFKKMVVPRLKAWIKKVVAEASESKVNSPSSKLAEEAAEAAKAAASAAALVAKASQELLSTKNEERKYFETFIGALDVQVKEMKSMGDAIRRLENRRDDRFSEDKLRRENIYSTTGNGSINNAWRTSQVNQSDHVKVNGTSNTNFGEVRSPSPPASMESISVANRNSYTEPWEAPQQAQQRPSSTLQPQSSDERFSSKTEESYGPSSEKTGNAHDASEPWWLKKSIKATEIKPEEEWKQFNERPKPRGWVPPQPPAVVLPEAADAIRRPKPPVQKQQSVDEQSVASSDDGKEREMRAPDSVAEAENSSSMPTGTSQSEIQEEKVVSLEVR